MQAVCSHCGTAHVLDDAQIAGHPRVQFRCSKCGKPTILDVALHPDRTQVISPLPEFARGAGSGGSGASVLGEYQGLMLPAGKVVRLEAVSGPASGMRPIELRKPRVVLGRGGADVEVNDPEVSRWHCALEIQGEAIRLRDLESTNGTYFEGERTRAAELRDGSEFRVGSTVFRLTITPK